MGAYPVAAVVLVAAQSLVTGCGSSQGTGGPAADAGGQAQLESGTTAGDGPVPPSQGDGGVAAACDDFHGALVGCTMSPSSFVAHEGPRFRQFCVNQASLPGSTTTVEAIEQCAQAYKADCTSSCGSRTSALCQEAPRATPGSTCSARAEAASSCPMPAVPRAAHARPPSWLARRAASPGAWATALRALTAQLPAPASPTVPRARRARRACSARPPRSAPPRRTPARPGQRPGRPARRTWNARSVCRA